MNIDELPFFFALLDHLHDAECPVPQFITAKDDSILQNIAGKPACLIEFLEGETINQPKTSDAHSMGKVLAQMHNALEHFSHERPNDMSIAGWHKMFQLCKEKDVGAIDSKLYDRIQSELDYLNKHWPTHLPKSVIHADLFPDNVLMSGDTITGVIDFYFAASDIIDYDVAISHAAWCFSNDGTSFDPEISKALLNSYNDARPLSPDSIKYLPILLRGACLRFILSRTVDWINTPEDAMVVKKDPMAFVNRLDYYTSEQHINHILNFTR